MDDSYVKRLAKIYSEPGHRGFWWDTRAGSGLGHAGYPGGRSSEARVSAQVSGLSGGLLGRDHGGLEEAGPDELAVGLAGGVALELADDFLACLARGGAAG